MMTSTESDVLADVPLLRGYAPYTLAGYASFRAVIDQDGAVPARLKALFVSVAAIDRRYPELARRELKRAVALGLTVREATAGLIVLTSLRGEAAALEFAGVLSEAFDTLSAPHPQPLPGAEPGEAEANFRAYFGTIPPPLAQLLRLVPAAADAYYLMRRGSIDANPLSAETWRAAAPGHPCRRLQSDGCHACARRAQRRRLRRGDCGGRAVRHPRRGNRRVDGSRRDARARAGGGSRVNTRST